MRYKVNLLPAAEQSLLDKVVFFSYTYLRYILVLTLLVVNGVFIYRFTVDQDIVELKDTLNQKEEIVNVSKPLLKEVTEVENKTKYIKVVLAQQNTYESMMEYFLSRFPDDIVSTHMALVGDGIQFDAVSNDIQTINLFYNTLVQEKRFSVIQMKNLKKSDSGYEFSLSLQKFLPKK